MQIFATQRTWIIGVPTGSNGCKSLDIVRILSRIEHHQVGIANNDSLEECETRYRQLDILHHIASAMHMEDNRIDELKSRARDASATGDYRGLIAAFDELSAGRKFDDTDDVDDAIRDYNKFLRKTRQFPAKVFVDLLHITF